MEAAPPPAAAIEGAAPQAAGLNVLIYALFFTFGGITSLNDVLIPKLKGLFHLNYGEVMLVQSAFFLSYLVISLPAGWLVARLGYMRSAVVGLLTMAVGAALFYPAAKLEAFAPFLGALFVVAAGITVVQVVSNPLISLLGKAETASSRLTFAQAFNSLGTTLFPFFGSMVILGAVATVKTVAGQAAVVGASYLYIAAALVVVAGVIYTQRHRLTEQKAKATNPLASIDLLKRPRFAFGVACIFVYVGAEVSIGSLLVNFLGQPNTLALTPEVAGRHLIFYWGGAMVGRFIGTFVLRMVSPGKVLAAVAAMNMVLLACAGAGHGAFAGWSLLAMGLFNSIMFPTIFTLASEGLGPRAAEGSGLLSLAIFGGAVVPALTGQLADHFGLSLALLAPAVCYMVIGGFGWYARRPADDAAASETVLAAG